MQNPRSVYNSAALADGYLLLRHLQPLRLPLSDCSITATVPETMPTLERSALVTYSAQQMFELVNDVDAYPQFLPWCAGSSTLERGEDYYVARVDIRKGPISQHFTTRNKLVSNEAIHMTLEDGPFKTLNGEWGFKEIGELGCKVSFSIDFTFSNFLLEKTLSPIFNEICTRMVDAFVARAKQVYG